jgi:hypothetical protein
MPNITGHCLCGQVRYESKGEPVFVQSCHCKTCQRHSGAAFSTLIAVLREMITVTGDVRTFTEPGGTSGEPIHRRFCPNCGSPVTVEREGSPRVLLFAGTLDDTGFVKPTANIFCESAQSWVALSPDVPNFPKYPPLS